MNTNTAWNKSCFILLDRSDFDMIDDLFGGKKNPYMVVSSSLTYSYISCWFSFSKIRTHFRHKGIVTSLQWGKRERNEVNVWDPHSYIRIYSFQIVLFHCLHWSSYNYLLPWFQSEYKLVLCCKCLCTHQTLFLMDNNTLKETVISDMFKCSPFQNEKDEQKNKKVS